MYFLKYEFKVYKQQTKINPSLKLLKILASLVFFNKYLIFQGCYIFFQRNWPKIAEFLAFCDHKFYL